MRTWLKGLLPAFENCMGDWAIGILLIAPLEAKIDLLFESGGKSTVSSGIFSIYI